MIKRSQPAFVWKRPTAIFGEIFIPTRIRRNILKLLTKKTPNIPIKNRIR